MKKEDCRLGMVVFHREFEVKGVVVKCNPKKAKVRIVEEIKNGRRRGVAAGSLWNMPYSGLEPVVDAGTEMAMRSFEQPENDGIKTYFKHVARADEPVDFPEDSPEHHLMRAVCELWRRLAREEDRRRNSDTINRIFGIFGREVSRSAAERWEAGKVADPAV